ARRRLRDRRCRAGARGAVAPRLHREPGLLDPRDLHRLAGVSALRRPDLQRAPHARASGRPVFLTPMELSVHGTTIYGQSVGDGRPCVCLHGGPGTDASGLTRTLTPLAAELGLRLIFYDHRGHGRSEWVPVEQCTQDQLVSDVEGVRTALGLGPVHVLGISWGGFLGLMYAARHPSSIRTLAVVGASASRDFMRLADAHA